MAIVTTDDKYYKAIADAIRNKTNVGALKPAQMTAAIEGISSGGEPIVGATNMDSMFQYSAATTLNLSSFDTSNVTTMAYMFQYSAATTLDLSSFDTSKVTNTDLMFQYSAATAGWARTQADADKFNASSGKPAGLTFYVKP